MEEVQDILKSFCSLEAHTSRSFYASSDLRICFRPGSESHDPEIHPNYPKMMEQANAFPIFPKNKLLLLPRTQNGRQNVSLRASTLYPS